MSTTPSAQIDPTPLAPVETAPSAIVTEGPALARAVGFAGLFLLVLGAVVIVTTRAVGPRWVSEGWGFVFAGFGAGFLVYTLGSIDKSVPSHDAISAGATLASAAVMVAAALYLEHSCRAPTPPDDEDRDGQPNKRGVR